MAHMENQIDYDFDLAAECCDAFSRSTNLGCALTSAEGQTLFSSGFCCSNCKLCSAVGKQAKTCVESHIYAMREAERFGGRFVYFCPMGLTCFVSPLKGSLVNSAKLTAGPFLMVDLEDYINYDLKIVHKLDDKTIRKCRPLLEKLPFVSPDRVSSMSTMLFMSVSFLNDMTVSLHMLNTINHHTMQGQINDCVASLKTEKFRPYPRDTESRLLYNIANANSSQAHLMLNELLGYYFYAASGNLENIKVRCLELNALMVRAAVDGGVSTDRILFCNDEFYQKLWSQNSFDDICGWCARTLDELVQSVKQNSNIKRIDIIHKAIQYIQGNYSQKITLVDVAQTVFLSPAYFSKIFKEEMGCSFREYLNNYRIEKSMVMLLNENIKASTIAYMVGFDDQSYFTKVFKKIVGITPNQYRENQGRLKMNNFAGNL